eukprot:3511779-Rhodomonas_salina.1
MAVVSDDQDAHPGVVLVTNTNIGCDRSRRTWFFSSSLSAQAEDCEVNVNFSQLELRIAIRYPGTSIRGAMHVCYA